MKIPRKITVELVTTMEVADISKAIEAIAEGADSFSFRVERLHTEQPVIRGRRSRTTSAPGWPARRPLGVGAMINKLILAGRSDEYIRSRLIDKYGPDTKSIHRLGDYRSQLQLEQARSGS